MANLRRFQDAVYHGDERMNDQAVASRYNPNRINAKRMYNDHKKGPYGNPSQEDAPRHG